MIRNKLITTDRRAAIRGASFLLFVMAVAGLIAGCSNHSDSDDNTSSNANFSTDTMKSSDAVATVNGEPITAKDYMDAMMRYVPATIQNFPNNQALAQPAGAVVLRSLIVDKITVQLAKSSGVPVQQSDIDQAYSDYNLNTQAQTVLAPDAMLLAQGYTPIDFKAEVLTPQAARFNLLAKTVVISPEALKQSYQSQINNYMIPAAVHVHRIGCATKQQAQNVVDGLKSGHKMGEFLADNVAGTGGDPTDDTNYVNWIHYDPIETGLAAPLAAMLAAAKVGSVVGPVQLGNNWWAIQVVEKRPKQVLPYDKVQGLVEVNYVKLTAGQNGNMQVQEEILQAMHDAVIRVNIQAYAGLAEQLHDVSGQTPVQPAVPQGATGSPAPSSSGG